MTVETGSIIIILLSIVGAHFWARLSNFPLRITFAIIFPFVAAYALYWLPLLQEPDKSEYSAWWGIFVGVWFISSVPFSVIATYFFHKRRKKSMGLR